MGAILGNLGLAEILIGLGAIFSLSGTLLLGARQGKEQIKTRDKIINEQRNLVTGGESYFFLRPSKVVGSDEVILVTEFRGNYPIYDMTIDIQEYDRVPQGASYAYIATSAYSMQMGTLHPLKSSSILKQFTLPTQGLNEFGKRYFLKISTRNGFVEEDIYIRGTNNGYTQAYKVVQFLPKYGESTFGYPLDRIKARVKKIDASFPMTDLNHLNGDSGWNREYENE